MKITREQLKNIVREVMTEESEYQTFFKKALEKTGKSIPQMSDEEKKAFFNKIDAAWKGKGEKNERFGRGHEGPTFGSADEQVEELTKAQEKLPPALKKAIEKKEKNESVNEARTVSKPIKVDNDTMVQIVGDNKGFRELTAALNPKTGKPIQKFGFDRGNETAKSKEELIKKLQKKYGKSTKFESVNENNISNLMKIMQNKYDRQGYSLKKLHDEVINYLGKKDGGLVFQEFIKKNKSNKKMQDEFNKTSF